MLLVIVLLGFVGLQVLLPLAVRCRKLGLAWDKGPQIVVLELQRELSVPIHRLLSRGKGPVSWMLVMWCYVMTGLLSVLPLRFKDPVMRLKILAPASTLSRPCLPEVTVTLSCRHVRLQGVLNGPLSLGAVVLADEVVLLIRHPTLEPITLRFPGASSGVAMYHFLFRGSSVATTIEMEELHFDLGHVGAQVSLMWLVQLGIMYYTALACLPRKTPGSAKSSLNAPLPFNIGLGIQSWRLVLTECTHPTSLVIEGGPSKTRFEMHSKPWRHQVSMDGNPQDAGEWDVCATGEVERVVMCSEIRSVVSSSLWSSLAQPANREFCSCPRIHFTLQFGSVLKEQIFVTYTHMALDCDRLDILIRPDCLMFWILLLCSAYRPIKAAKLESRGLELPSLSEPRKTPTWFLKPPAECCRVPCSEDAEVDFRHQVDPVYDVVVQARQVVVTIPLLAAKSDLELTSWTDHSARLELDVVLRQNYEATVVTSEMGRLYPWNDGCERVLAAEFSGLIGILPSNSLDLGMTVDRVTMDASPLAAMASTSAYNSALTTIFADYYQRSTCAIYVSERHTDRDRCSFKFAVARHLTLRFSTEFTLEIQDTVMEKWPLWWDDGGQLRFMAAQLTLSIAGNSLLQASEWEVVCSTDAAKTENTQEVPLIAHEVPILTCLRQVRTQWKSLTVMGDSEEVAAMWEVLKSYSGLSAAVIPWELYVLDPPLGEGPAWCIYSLGSIKAENDTGVDVTLYLGIVIMELGGSRMELQVNPEATTAHLDLRCRVTDERLRDETSSFDSAHSSFDLRDVTDPRELFVEASDFRFVMEGRSGIIYCGSLCVAQAVPWSTWTPLPVLRDCLSLLCAQDQEMVWDTLDVKLAEVLVELSLVERYKGVVLDLHYHQSLDVGYAHIRECTLSAEAAPVCLVEALEVTQSAIQTSVTIEFVDLGCGELSTAEGLVASGSELISGLGVADMCSGPPNHMTLVLTRGHLHILNTLTDLSSFVVEVSSNPTVCRITKHSDCVISYKFGDLEPYRGFRRQTSPINKLGDVSDFTTLALTASGVCFRAERGTKWSCELEIEQLRLYHSPLHEIGILYLLRALKTRLPSKTPAQKPIVELTVTLGDFRVNCFYLECYPSSGDVDVISLLEHYAPVVQCFPEESPSVNRLESRSWQRELVSGFQVPREGRQDRRGLQLGLGLHMVVLGVSVRPGSLVCTVTVGRIACFSDPIQLGGLRLYVVADPKDEIMWTNEETTLTLELTKTESSFTLLADGGVAALNMAVNPVTCQDLLSLVQVCGADASIRMVRFENCLLPEPATTSSVFKTMRVEVRVKSYSVCLLEGVTNAYFARALSDGLAISWTYKFDSTASREIAVDVGTMQLESLPSPLSDAADQHFMRTEFPLQEGMEGMTDKAHWLHLRARIRTLLRGSSGNSLDLPIKVKSPCIYLVECQVQVNGVLHFNFSSQFLKDMKAFLQMSEDDEADCQSHGPVTETSDRESQTKPTPPATVIYCQRVRMTAVPVRATYNGRSIKWHDNQFTVSPFILERRLLPRWQSLLLKYSWHLTRQATASLLSAKVAFLWPHAAKPQENTRTDQHPIDQVLSKRKKGMLARR